MVAYMMSAEESIIRQARAAANVVEAAVEFVSTLEDEQTHCSEDEYNELVKSVRQLVGEIHLAREIVPD